MIKHGSGLSVRAREHAFMCTRMCPCALRLTTTIAAGRVCLVCGVCGCNDGGAHGGAHGACTTRQACTTRYTYIIHMATGSYSSLKVVSIRAALLHHSLLPLPLLQMRVWKPTLCEHAVASSFKLVECILLVVVLLLLLLLLLLLWWRR